LATVASLVGRHVPHHLHPGRSRELCLSAAGEVSLLVGAYEAQRGVLGLGWVVVIGALAAISGDNLAYLLGAVPAGR